MNESTRQILLRRGWTEQPNGSLSKPSKPSKPRLQPRRERPTPIVERHLGNAALGALQVQELHTGRFLVRITSVRKRLIDEDNLCEKFHVDCCRYAGILPSDGPAKTSIEVSQRKAEKGEEEEVLVEVFHI